MTKTLLHPVSQSDSLTLQSPLFTHLIVLQAADHELSEDDHSGATHAGTTVHHHRRVEAL